MRSKQALPDYKIGMQVSDFGQLGVPSGPALPGGFDFRRYLYFQGIGGVGFFFKPPEIISTPAEAVSWFDQARLYVREKGVALYLTDDKALLEPMLEDRYRPWH